MHAFTAHAAIARERRSTATASAGYFPPISLESPVRVPPGRPPRKRPVKTEFRLAGRPAGGLDDEHDSTPRNEAYGAKNTKSDGVSPRLRRVCSALTHVKARMGLSLTEG
jgi:hypothetical protein